MVNKNMVALANEDSNDEESIREDMYAAMDDLRQN